MFGFSVLLLSFYVFGPNTLFFMTFCNPFFKIYSFSIINICTAQFVTDYTGIKKRVRNTEAGCKLLKYELFLVFIFYYNNDVVCALKHF